MIGFQKILLSGLLLSFAVWKPPTPIFLLHRVLSKKASAFIFRCSNGTNVSPIANSSQSSKSFGVVFNSANHRVFLQQPTADNEPYIVTGNLVVLPDDIQPAITKAKENKTPLHVIAVHARFVNHMYLSPIPAFSVTAQTCLFQLTRNLIIDISAKSFHGKKYGHSARKGAHGGNIEFVCGQWKFNGNSKLTVATRGANGENGMQGENGANGENGSPDYIGYCRRELSALINCGATCVVIPLSSPICYIDFDQVCKFCCSAGHFGRLSTNGTNGTKGGDGGYGGDGGAVTILYGEKYNNRVPLIQCEGGRGGSGGPGGLRGLNGKFIPSSEIIRICGSESDRYSYIREHPGAQLSSRYMSNGICECVFEKRNRPRLYPTHDGKPGQNGNRGRTGKSKFASLKTRSFQMTNDKALIALADLSFRYASNLLMDGNHYDELSTVNTIFYNIASNRSDLPQLDIMARQAKFMAKLGQTHPFTGFPVELSRISPSEIEKKLDRELTYAKHINERLVLVQTNREFLSAVEGMASLSVSRTDFNSLLQDLKSRRNVLKKAVLSVESGIQRAKGAAWNAVLEYQKEKKRKDKTEKIKNVAEAVMLCADIALGLIEIPAMIEGAEMMWPEFSKLIENVFKNANREMSSFGKVTNGTKQLLKKGIDVAGNIKKAWYKMDSVSLKAKECSFNGLKSLIESASDRITMFPNFANLDADLSIIHNVDMITEVRRAGIQIEALALSNQFSCLFGMDVEDVVELRNSVRHYFILAETRVVLLGKIRELDVQKQQIIVEKKEQEERTKDLKALQRKIDEKLLSKQEAFQSLLREFDLARAKVMDGMKQLAAVYLNLALKKVDESIKWYAQRSLEGNGVLDISDNNRYVSLEKVANELRNKIQSVHSCVSARETPTEGYYSFEIPRDDLPDGFRSGDDTGETKRCTLVLDIQKNCVVYQGSRAPKLIMDTDHHNLLDWLLGWLTHSRSTPVCKKHIQFNTRLTGMGIQFVGGDENRLPSNANNVPVYLKQIGMQSFLAKPDEFVQLEVEPLEISVGLVPLRTTEKNEVQLNAVCSPSKEGLLSLTLDKGRLCPSPYSTYLLQIGTTERPDLAPFLRTVQAVRIHTRLSSYAHNETATQCFG